MFPLGHLKKLMYERPLIIDGATSTMLGQFMLPNTDGNYLPDEFTNFDKAPCDLDILTAPQAVMGLHLDYILSGADIITTNSFNLNSLTLKEFDLEKYSIFLNVKAAIIARSCAKVTGKIKKGNIIVAGVIGPTKVSLSTFAENDRDEESMSLRISKVFGEQAIGLIIGGVDVIMLETFYDYTNLECALKGVSAIFIEHNIEIPVMVSVTPDKNGKLSSGEGMKEIVELCRQYYFVESLGLNCGYGADAMRLPLEELAEYSPYPITCHPNADVPTGREFRNQTPAEFASSMVNLASKIKIRAAGGCCGTTPSHILALSKALKGINYFDNIYAEGYSDN